MTHEELLAKIKPALHYPEFCANCACGADFKEMYKLNLHIEEANNAYIWALRKIVELHKPKETTVSLSVFGAISEFRPEEITKITLCDSCGRVEYPCPTIQAIEKELQ